MARISEKQITIVVKGADGSGRSQIGELIALTLAEAGYGAVIRSTDGVDVYEDIDDRKEQPIHIIEMATHS